MSTRTWMPMALGLALLHCAPRVRVAPRTTHEGDTPVAVPYPPPPAQVEMIGEAPSETAVWVDGSWRWTGSTYVWTEGGWTEPVPGALYAPAAAVRLPSGQLIFYQGRWHLPAAAAAPAPAVGGASPSTGRPSAVGPARGQAPSADAPAP